MSFTGSLRTATTGDTGMVFTDYGCDTKDEILAVCSNYVGIEITPYDFTSTTTLYEGWSVTVNSCNVLDTGYDTARYHLALYVTKN